MIPWHPLEVQFFSGAIGAPFLSTRGCPFGETWAVPGGRESPLTVSASPASPVFTQFTG